MLQTPGPARFSFAILFISLAISSASQVAADWKDDIGFTQLQSELGAATPTGGGVNVSFVEAAFSGRYLPQPATSNSNMVGKTITDVTGTNTGISSHANVVSNHFFGNSESIAPGVDTIDAYEAGDWLNFRLGLFDSVTELQVNRNPEVQPYAVQNHSYVSTSGSTALATNLAQRVDHVINRDNVLIIAATNNGANSAVPELLAHSYNAINVGLTLGDHAHGDTTFYGSGRPRPDIVAPHGATTTQSSTSFATPMVSSAAAMLHEYAAANQVNATNVEAMRAVLMAGATKEEFSSWDRTATRPIDEQFGAGELNVYNSYKILEGGEYDGTVITPLSPVGLFGYDYNSPMSMLAPYLYEFEVGPGQQLNNLSIFLQWNIDVQDLNASPFGFDPFVDMTPGGDLANLDLHLFDINNALVDQSISTEDNFEHIYVSGLTAGTYTLQVSGDRAVDYGLAWRSFAVAVPEPSSALAIGVAMCGLVLRRRRHSLVA